MSGIVFIHWNDDEAKELAAPLEAAGWSVSFGLPAKLSALRAAPPAAVVISLRRLPSHGREVADAVWSTKWGREIPIVFVDGEKEKITKLKDQFPNAKYATMTRLPAVLAKFNAC